MMDPEIVEIVNQQLIKQFPYLKGVDPLIEEHPQGGFVLRYASSVQTCNEQVLPIIIKAIVDEKGKILNLVSSR